jgi:hypothetical protein
MNEYGPSVEWQWQGKIGILGEKILLTVKKKRYFDQLSKYKLLKEKSVQTLVENPYLVCRSVKKTALRPLTIIHEALLVYNKLKYSSDLVNLDFRRTFSILLTNFRGSMQIGIGH